MFFSNHVIEHVPSVLDMLKLAVTKLKPDGVLVLFCPNGSDAYRRVAPNAWTSSWGMHHPNLIDDEFYRSHFPNAILASNSYDIDKINKVACSENWGQVGTLDGNELLAVCRASDFIVDPISSK